jgi:uncharacterized membrane protein (UPF0136 family)
MITFAKFYFLAFAALTAAGGILGYVKSQSTPSLIAGVVSGLLLAAAGVLMPQKTLVGGILGVVVSLLLLGKFLPAVMKGSGNMAALPISILGAAGTLIAIVTLIRR